MGADRSMQSCASEVHQRFGVKIVAITDGKDAGLVSVAENDDVQQWWVHPATVEQASFRSPIGAGDACSAGLVAALIDGLSPPEAFAEGQAVASASCMTDQCSNFDT